MAQTPFVNLAHDLEIKSNGRFQLPQLKVRFGDKIFHVLLKKNFLFIFVIDGTSLLDILAWFCKQTKHF